jgi:hypothetical protein
MKLLKERKEVWNRYGLALLAAYAFKTLGESPESDDGDYKSFHRRIVFRIMQHQHG